VSIENLPRIYHFRSGVRIYLIKTLVQSLWFVRASFVADVTATSALAPVGAVLSFYEKCL
jgi:hypothetical protein